MFFPVKTIVLVFEEDIGRPRVFRRLSILETADWSVQFTFWGLKPDTQTHISTAYKQMLTEMEIKQDGKAIIAIENCKGDLGTPPYIDRTPLGACPIRTCAEQ